MTCGVGQVHLNQENWWLSFDPIDSVGSPLKKIPKAANMNEFSVPLLQTDSPKIDEPMQAPHIPTTWTKL